MIPFTVTMVMVFRGWLLGAIGVVLSEHSHGLKVERTHSPHEGFLHVLFIELLLRFQPGHFLVGLVQGSVDL